MGTEKRNRLSKRGLFAAGAALLGALVVLTLHLPLAPGIVRNMLLLLLALLPMATYLLVSRQRVRATPAEGSEATGIVYEFGNCELDSGSRQLRFSGNPVEVQPRVFDLIEYLIRERGRAVGKDELFDKIWPSMVVSEGSLTQSIKRARNIFRENGSSHDVIKTVHSRGYRFDEEVQEVAAVRATADAGVRQRPLPVALSLLFGILLASLVWWGLPRQLQAPAAPANALVVLPFENLSSDPAFSWFSDGLTETLSQALAKVSGLKVIGRTSAFSFRETETSHAEIGRQLNVSSIIQGTVQRADDELRITASMIRASDGAVLWSEVYNEEFVDVFDVQDAIARSCVQRLEVTLAEQLAQPDDGSSIRDPQAYRLYLRANEQRQLRNDASLAVATELYKDALRIDPRYKEALLGLAQTTFRRATMGSIPRELSYTDAVALSRQALSIDPDYADAHILLGEIQHRHFWQFDEAAKSFERAIELNPGSADGHSAYARFLSKIGRPDKAVSEARVGRELDPLSPRANSSLAIRLIRVNQLDEARQVLDQMHQQFPENGDLPWLESLWNLRNESYAESLSQIAHEEYEYLRLSISAIAFHHLGRTSQAEESLQRLIELDADGATFQIAEVYAQWEQPDLAFEWLDRAVRKGDPGLAELLSSFSFEPVYGDPRFAEVLERVGLPPLNGALAGLQEKHN